VFTDVMGYTEVWTPDESFWDRLDPAVWEILENESYTVEFDDPRIDSWAVNS
jgi:hypothetical protein